MSQLRVQAVVNDFTSTSLTKFLQTLLLTDCPAAYQLQVHLLAYSNPQLDINLTVWQDRFAARNSELRFDFVPDCPGPLAAHNRATLLWPASDRLLLVEPDGLLPFHLIERLLGLAEVRPGCGAVLARQIPLAPPLSPVPASLEVTALAGGAYLLESATFTQFGFDENLPGLEIALLDLGWRLRAQQRCLYLAVETFVYRPRQVTDAGLVYRPGEELALLAGWGLLLDKYGQTEAAQAWHEQLEVLASAASVTARKALSLWETRLPTLHPATSQEIACADFSYSPHPADWLPSGNPDRNYGNRLEPNFEEIVSSSPIAFAPSTSLAAKLEEVLTSLDLSNAPLLDLSGTLQGWLAGSNLRVHSVKPGQLATLVGKQVVTDVPVAALALPQPNERSLLKKLADLTRQGHLRGVLLVAANPTHQDIAARLLAGNVPGLDWLNSAYDLTALQQLVAGTGWQIAGRYDLVNERSQFFTPDHLLHEDSLAGEAVRWLAHQFNSAATVEYFVWWLEPLGQPEQPASPQANPAWLLPPLRVIEDPLNPAAEKPTPTDAPPRVSVLIRTLGRRNELLLENFYSIYAQDCPPEAYEVMVALQLPPQVGRKDADDFYRLLPKLPPELVARIRVIEVEEAGQSVSLNPLLYTSRGDYWFLLDDDDLLLDGYLVALLEGIVQQTGQSPIFQTLGVRRDVEVYESPPAPALLDPAGYTPTYPYVVRRLELFWERPWRDVYQFFNNEFPPYSYALPRVLLEQTWLRYNTNYHLYEDWEFLMRAARLLKVVSLPVFAGCSNLRDNNTQTVGNSELAEGWQADYQRLAVERAREPLLLPGRAVGEIIASFQQIEELRQRLYEIGQQLEEARQVIALRDATTAELSRSLLEVGSELEYVRNHLEGQLAQTREQLGSELDYVRNHLTAELERTRVQIELRDAELHLVRQINLAHQIEINRLNEGRYLQYHQLEAVQQSADHYRQRLEELEPYARSLEQELAVMRTSPSWRLTLPLRLLRRLLGR